MRVRYYPIDPDISDNFILTKIRSEPWQLGHGEWVVKVEGKAGGVSISHLKPFQGKIKKGGNMLIFHGLTHKRGHRELELYSNGKTGISSLVINEDFPGFNDLWNGDWIANLKVTVTIEPTVPAEKEE